MNITEEKLLEYLSKALVCVAVIVIGYIITKLIIGISEKSLINHEWTVQPKALYCPFSR